MQKFRSFNQQGFLHKKKIIPINYLKDIKRDIIQIMSNYVRIIKKKNIDETLDKAFSDITKKSPTLRSNLFKVFCQLYKIPKLIYLENFTSILKKLNFESPIVIGYGILAMEPNQKRFLFNLHQDLRTTLTSYHAANIWIPLNNGKNIGGMGLFKKSHELGPIKHTVSKKNGHEEVNDKYSKKYLKEEFTNMKMGDCYLFSPYSLHYSIPNYGKRIRWTARLVIDDAKKAKHFEKRLEPYIKSNFCNSRTNEERLTMRFGKYRGK